MENATREEMTKYLMLSAEGGADYWSNVDFPQGVDDNYLPIGSIVIEDFDPDGVGNDKKATFTIEEYANVIDDFAKNAPEKLKGLSDFQNRFRGDWLAGNYHLVDYDHETADLIAQWALFDGNVIYG